MAGRPCLLLRQQRRLVLQSAIWAAGRWHCAHLARSMVGQECSFGLLKRLGGIAAWSDAGRVDLISTHRQATPVPLQ